MGTLSCYARKPFAAFEQYLEDDSPDQMELGENKSIIDAVWLCFEKVDIQPLLENIHRQQVWGSYALYRGYCDRGYQTNRMRTLCALSEVEQQNIFTSDEIAQYNDVMVQLYVGGTHMSFEMRRKDLADILTRDLDLIRKEFPHNSFMKQLVQDQLRKIKGSY